MIPFLSAIIGAASKIGPAVASAATKVGQVASEVGSNIGNTASAASGASGGVGQAAGKMGKVISFLKSANEVGQQVGGIADSVRKVTSLGGAPAPMIGSSTSQTQQSNGIVPRQSRFNFLNFQRRM